MTHTANKITPITITDVTMLRLFSDILKMTAKGFMFFMRVFSKPYLADITKILQQNLVPELMLLM